MLTGAVLAGIAWYNLSGAARTARAEARATRKAVRTHKRVHEGAGALLAAADADAAFEPAAMAGAVEQFVAFANAVWRKRAGGIRSLGEPLRARLGGRAERR